MKKKLVYLILSLPVLLHAFSSGASGRLRNGSEAENFKRITANEIQLVSHASAVIFNDRQSGVINQLNHDGLTQILVGITGLKEGLLGTINEKFSGNNPGWTWIVQDGELPENVNASTIYTAEGMLTTIDKTKMMSATKLSIARTFIHEMIHAYLTLYFYIDSYHAAIDFPLILWNWQNTIDPDLNEIQHAQMEASFIDDIALALSEYAAGLGIWEDAAILRDLAWGGLDYQNHNDFSRADKLRIQQRLFAEQLNSVVTSVKPIGHRLE